MSADQAQQIINLLQDVIVAIGFTGGLIISHTFYSLIKGVAKK